jgi:cold shock CspA family protein
MRRLKMCCFVIVLTKRRERYRAVPRRLVRGLRNQVRGPVADTDGRTHVYTGEVATIEDAYLFVRCPDFHDHIFVHRSRVSDENWKLLARSSRVAFTMGFNMRGPTAISINPLD